MVSRKKLSKAFRQLLPEFEEAVRSSAYSAAVMAMRDTMHADDSNAKKRKRKQNYEDRRIMSIMVNDLENSMSGTSSQGQDYTFASGEDAFTLSGMKKRLLSHNSGFSKEELTNVFKIYRRYLRQEAETLRGRFPRMLPADS